VYFIIFLEIHCEKVGPYLHFIFQLLLAEKVFVCNMSCNVYICNLLKTTKMYTFLEANRKIYVTDF
jgi:hypothetical protein